MEDFVRLAVGGRDSGSMDVSNRCADRERLILAHTSDLHLGSTPDGGVEVLRAVLSKVKQAGAHVLVLAGDVFDHNRVALGELDIVARLLGDAALPVVILPGNHDCLTVGSVYLRGGVADPPNVHVLGVTAASVTLADLDLLVWGRPHADYRDMSPLKDPLERRTRWHVAVAHGHWFGGREDRHRSWLIRNEEIEATGADYLALGHWERATSVGEGKVPAYYSGRPDLVGTINSVTFESGGVTVKRVSLEQRTTERP